MNRENTARPTQEETRTHRVLVRVGSQRFPPVGLLDRLLCVVDFGVEAQGLVGLLPSQLLRHGDGQKIAAPATFCLKSLSSGSEVPLEMKA